jgi:hypothetical protein
LPGTRLDLLIGPGLSLSTVETLLLLVIVALVAWFWVDSLRARETATAACRRACSQEGIQFLDDTVALERLGLARSAAGRLQLRRQYRFDYTEDGITRRRGGAVLVGGRLLTLTLPLNAGAAGST